MMSNERGFMSKIWFEASKVLVVGVIIVAVTGVNTFLLQDVYTKGAVDEKLSHERELQEAHRSFQEQQFEQLNDRLDRIETLIQDAINGG